MSEFHFLRPEWLFAIVPLVLLVWLLTHLHLKSRSWQSFCDPKLLPYLLGEQRHKKTRQPIVLILIAGVLLFVAMAGPTWEQRPQPVFKQQSALVLVLDLSRSMDAADIKPSRLTRARHKITDILRLRKEGQTALIVYAADAFTVTPLTEDTDTIESQVNSLTTGIMPSQGSRADKALNLARDLLSQAGQTVGDILLITDGVEKSMDDTIEKLSTDSYRLSILAIGHADGAPIPQPGGGFVKDAQGAIVIAKTNIDQLRQIATAGGGLFQTLTNDDTDIHRLLASVNTQHLTDKDSETQYKTDSWVEAGPWLLLFAIPLAAFAFRRGYLVLLVAFMLPIPEPAHALEWNTLWKNQNQQAQEQFKQGDVAGAADTFTNKKWKAAAHYRAEQYQQALETYESIASPDMDTLYNKANTLAKLGRIPDAIKTYDQVLEKNPQHEDAQYNRELLQQQSQEQQQSGDQGDQSSDDQQQQTDQQSEQQSSDNDQQQPSDDVGEQQSSDDQQQDQQQDDQQPSEQEQQTAQQNNSDDNERNESPQAAEKTNTETESEHETRQANEQWLRRIPDDPSGLLKRKFQYQSELRKRQGSENDEQQQW